MSTDTNMETLVVDEPSVELVDPSAKEQVVAGIRAVVQLIQQALKNPKMLLSCKELRGVLCHIHSAATLRLYLERLLMESGMGELLGALTQIPAPHLYEIFHLFLSSELVESVVSFTNHVISDVKVYKLASRAIPLVLNEILPVLVEFIGDGVHTGTVPPALQTKFDEVKQKLLVLIEQVFSEATTDEKTEDDQCWLELHAEMVGIVNSGRDAAANRCPTVALLGDKIQQIETELQILRGQYVCLATNAHHPSSEEWTHVNSQVDVLGELMCELSNELHGALVDDTDDEECICDENCECHEG